MLVFVHLQSLLIAAHTHEWLDIYVIIHTIHISIGMMYDIVLVMPDKAISAQNAQREGSHLIDQFAFTKTPVSAVVHHIESDRRNHTSE